MSITIRPEHSGDEVAIRDLTEAAFRDVQHSDHTEHLIIDRLRSAEALTVSLVAEAVGVVVGHVAVSPVSISDGSRGWYGVGPVSVSPDRQGQGIGSRLMEAALQQLRQLPAGEDSVAAARGCVLLGEPGFYQRFGFVAAHPLELPGVPAEYFQVLAFRSAVPTGIVSYHSAFGSIE